jgi:serine/threonine protein kinase
VRFDPNVVDKSAEDIAASMGAPVTAEVRTTHVGNHMPRYLVLPSPLPEPKSLDDCKVKLVDFGSSFFSEHQSSTAGMRCPLPFRAPEAVITRQWDKEADIWSLGCTVRTRIVSPPT